jgi:hypothetical protein
MFMADNVKITPEYKFGLSVESKKCLDEAKEKLSLLTNGFVSSDNSTLFGKSGMYRGELYMGDFRVWTGTGHTNFIGDPAGSSSYTAAVGALAANLVVPEFQQCMNGKSPFVPRNPALHQPPVPWDPKQVGR